MNKEVGSITTELVFIDSLTIAILGLIAAPLIQNILLNPPEEGLLNSLRFEKIAIVLYLSSLIGTISIFIAGIALTLFIRSYYLKGIPISKELVGWDIALTVNSTIGVAFLLFTLLNFIEPNSIIGLNPDPSFQLNVNEHGNCTEFVVSSLSWLGRNNIENLFREPIGIVVFGLTLIFTSIYSISIIGISYGWKNIYRYAFVDDSIEQIEIKKWLFLGLLLFIFYIIWFTIIAHCQNNIDRLKSSIMLGWLFMFPYFILYHVIRHFYSGKYIKTSANMEKLYSMHKDVYEKLYKNNIKNDDAICYFKSVINIRNNIKNDYIDTNTYIYNEIKKNEIYYNNNNYYSRIKIEVSHNDIKIYRYNNHKWTFDIEFRFIEALDSISINYKLYPPINRYKAIGFGLCYIGFSIFLFLFLYTDIIIIDIFKIILINIYRFITI